jgi:hypothetical protein
MKLDIEEGEYDLIRSISDDNLKKIKQLVIEIHFPFTDDRWDLLNRLSKYHKLVHIHGNNCEGTKLYNGIQVPHVFECTYIFDEGYDLELNDEPIPSPILDQSNITGRSDLQLFGYPYTSK